MLLEHLPILALTVLTFNGKTFSEKKGVEKTSPVDVIYMRFILSGIICAGIIFFIGRHKKILEYSKDQEVLKYVILMSLFSMFSVYGYYRLLQEYDASYVIAITTPLFIIVSILIDMIFYKKECNKMKFLGVLVVTLGLYLIYKSNKKK